MYYRPRSSDYSYALEMATKRGHLDGTFRRLEDALTMGISHSSSLNPTLKNQYENYMKRREDLENYAKLLNELFPESKTKKIGVEEFTTKVHPKTEPLPMELETLMTNVHRGASSSTTMEGQSLIDYDMDMKLKEAALNNMVGEYLLQHQKATTDEWVESFERMTRPLPQDEELAKMEVAWKFPNYQYIFDLEAMELKRDYEHIKYEERNYDFNQSMDMLHALRAHNNMPQLEVQANYDNDYGEKIMGHNYLMEESAKLDYYVTGYEHDMINYILKKPEIQQKTDPEMKENYMYTVMNDNDYQQLLRGEMVLDRRHYKPMNWCTNARDALSFMNYLIRRDYEKMNETGDYHLVAMPLRKELNYNDGTICEEKTFNRHYMSYYFHYESRSTATDDPQETIRVPKEMYNYINSWNITKEVFTYYEDNLKEDKNIFRDYSRHYYPEEVGQKEYLWGTILEYQDAFRFINYYRKYLRNSNNNIVYYFPADLMNYFNNISEGCTKWPDTTNMSVEEASMTNYVIMLMAHYYRETHHWDSPLIIQSML